MTVRRWPGGEGFKVLRALRPIPSISSANGVVMAQYSGGTVAGESVEAYRDAAGVGEGSATETFVAFKAFVDNWRWAGVPFYLRTGKCLPQRCTEISIHFEDGPQVLFNRPPTGPSDAYERLLLDAAVGDATLFTRSDEVETAWRFVTPVIEGCINTGCTNIALYEAGAWGPAAANELIEADGRAWHLV